MVLDGVLRKLSFRPVIFIAQGVILLVNMVVLKMLIGKLLQVEDDVSSYFKYIKQEEQGT